MTLPDWPIIQKPYQYLRKKINSGHEQSVELKKNIAVSVLIKLVSLVLGLFYMPTILSFVDKSLLGIVMTIDSFVSWLYLADIGIGNGLKNKLAEAIALNNMDRAKRMVSTAYIALSSIMFVVFLIAAVAASFVNWNSVLKVDVDSHQLLWSIQFILFALLSSFAIRLINSVFQAYQMSFLNSMTALVIKLVKLLAVLVAIQLTKANILKFVLIDHSVPIIVLLGFSFVLFNGKFKSIKPSIKDFDRAEINSITGLGIKFFWIQIASMILFSTDNAIIVRIFTAGDVTVYNMIRHYYSQIFIIMTFVSVPLWSAYTKAIALDDIEWIKRITKKILVISTYLSLIILVMFIVYQPVIKFWLRGKIQVPVSLSLVMALSQIAIIYTTPFNNFINGAGKLRLSMWLSPIVIILNIPMAVLFAKPLGMGVTGVIFATLICNVASLVVNAIQYYKIVYQNAPGIWNK